MPYFSILTSLTHVFFIKSKLIRIIKLKHLKVSKIRRFTIQIICMTKKILGYSRINMHVKTNVLAILSRAKHCILVVHYETARSYGSKALKEQAKQDLEIIKMVKATKCMMMKQEIQILAYTLLGTIRKVENIRPKSRKWNWLHVNSSNQEYVHFKFSCIQMHILIITEKFKIVFWLPLIVTLALENSLPELLVALHR